ncbi:group-specific protein [Pontibacillus sp. HMF3514]|uniref:group-specific protein n=1 Tax=Pontibacillus sp. HMF3514 TaxID=2692425 RepID=UPI001F3CE17B|nr:group-specific protein [Pontibacillus sp. HMF3514]
MVPKNMFGDYLMPLNRLKVKDEELYKKYIKKYEDHPKRTKLHQRKIPKLDCLWNDVIHFLPLHPNHVYEALKTFEVNTRTDLLFYKVPIENLSNNQNVIYQTDKASYQGPDKDIPNKHIHIIDTQQYEGLTSIPQDTMDYYKEEIRKGNKFGMFQFIPHLFSDGEVDISNAKVINWSKKIDEI